MAKLEVPVVLIPAMLPDMPVKFEPSPLNDVAVQIPVILTPVFVVRIFSDPL